MSKSKLITKVFLAAVLTSALVSCNNPSYTGGQKNIVKDNLCFKEWMTHPLIYYRVKKKLKGSPGP